MNIQKTFNALRQPYDIEQACWSCKFHEDRQDFCVSCGEVHFEDTLHPDHTWVWNGVSNSNADEPT